MAFKPRNLDGSIDFAIVPENEVNIIEGKNQTVYWKGSNVTVYENDSEGKQQTRKLVNWPEGQGQVPFGTKLYVTAGKVTDK